MHSPALQPRRVQAASVGGGGDSGKSAAARILGSGSAGVMELALFHPVDTVAKRLMSYEVRCGWLGGVAVLDGGVGCRRGRLVLEGVIGCGCGAEVSRDGGVVP